MKAKVGHLSSSPIVRTCLLVVRLDTFKIIGIDFFSFSIFYFSLLGYAHIASSFL